MSETKKIEYGPEIEEAIGASARYLQSDEALRSLETNMYWPKWHSPWWHMLLLHELERHEAIPNHARDALARALNAFPYREFPFRSEDVPTGINEFDTFCHCMLGTVLPVLAGCGLNVEEQFGWTRDWFVRYQMSDGGLNCDNAAYLVKNETPSSIVGTVSPLEAMLLLDAHRSNETSRKFIDAAGAFLVQRKLSLGSCTHHNAEERTNETDWQSVTFPRFYFHDNLRGLNALTTWAEHRGIAIPRSAFVEVEESLVRRFSKNKADGEIRVERNAWPGKQTRLQVDSGNWTRGNPALSFQLLEVVSQLGSVSPALTAQWRRVCSRLKTLSERGLIQEG